MLERLLAKRHISRLDLTSIRHKSVEKLNWNSEKAQQVELQYRRFLYALARKRPEEVISPPSVDVDEFWHQHILDTRKYRADCDKILGHYVDHTPGLEAEEQSRADARREKVYADYDIDNTYFELGDSNSSPAYVPAAGGSTSHHAHGGHGGHGTQHGSSHGSDAGGHGGIGHDGGDGHGGDGDGNSGGADGGGDGGGDSGGFSGGGCSGGGCSGGS